MTEEHNDPCSPFLSVAEMRKPARWPFWKSWTFWGQDWILWRRLRLQARRRGDRASGQWTTRRRIPHRETIQHLLEEEHEWPRNSLVPNDNPVTIIWDPTLDLMMISFLIRLEKTFTLQVGVDTCFGAALNAETLYDFIWWMSNMIEGRRRAL